MDGAYIGESLGSESSRIWTSLGSWIEIGGVDWTFLGLDDLCLTFFLPAPTWEVPQVNP